MHYRKLIDSINITSYRIETIRNEKHDLFFRYISIFHYKYYIIKENISHETTSKKECYKFQRTSRQLYLLNLLQWTYICLAKLSWNKMI